MKKNILHSNKSEPDEGCTFGIESTKVFSKNKTHLLSFIIGMFLVFLPFTTFAQVQEDLRLQTQAYTEGKCPANDIRILGASLVTSDPCSSCAPNTQITADLKIRMTNGTGSDRYFAICATVTGGTPANISRCYFAPANSTQIFDAGQVTFTCGSVVTLDHILLAWTAASGNCPVTLANNPNGKYCFAIPPIIVSTPFAANPVSTCSATEVGKMNVALNVSGGSGDFSFLWSDGSTLGNRTNITIGTYTVTVTDNVLKEANGTPCSHVLNVGAAQNCCVNPNAGADGNTTVCDSSTDAIQLRDLITGEENGGTWSRTSGTGGTFNAAAGTFIPAVGASAVSTFTYLIDVNGPCVDDSSVATVNINHQPNAGADGNTTVCDSSTDAIQLRDLITGEENGGTWSRTSGTGGTFNAAAGTFIPAVGASAVSTFTYLIDVNGPCVDDSSVATVNINHQPNAGADGNTTVCDSSTDAIQLRDLITGEENGGTWSRTSGTGGTFNAAAGTFIPAVGASAVNTFTYLIDVNGPCVDDSSVATVNINHQPNAGADGNTTVCDSSTDAIQLRDLITGEENGGTWSRTSGTGGTFNAAAGTFIPAVGASAVSTFTYLIDVNAPCVDDSSVATVNISHNPNAGADGNTTVCDSSTDAIQLRDLITGEENGGTWSRTSGTGGTFNAAAGTFIPAVGASAVSTFTYLIDVNEPCVDDSSVATVNINHQPNAGTGGSTTVCENSSVSISLADLITGEEPGGTWTRESGTGGTFNAAAGTFVPTGASTTNTFKYTLSATAPCIADDTTVTVNLNGQPDAGTGGSTRVCIYSASTITLADLIAGEDSGGTWTRESGTGGTFDAAAGTFVPTNATTSTFKYTLSATAPCVEDSSTVTVTVDPRPVITCPADPLYEVNCSAGLTAAQQQLASDTAFNNWISAFNTYVIGLGYVIDNTQYSYDPLGADPAVGNAPIIIGFTEVVVTVNFTVRNPDTGCINSCTATYTISNNCAIRCNPSSTPALCKGGASGTVTAVAFDGFPPYNFYLYNVNGDNSLGSLVAGPIGDAVAPFTYTFTDLAAGTYAVLITDGVQTLENASRCDRIVGEPTAALDLVSLAPTNASCNGSDGTILATISGGTPPYTIAIDPVDPADSTGAVAVVGTTYTFTGVASGSHTVYVYDANYASSSERGCYDYLSTEVGADPCGESNCTYTQGYYGDYNGAACTPDGTPTTDFQIMVNAVTQAVGQSGNPVIFGLTANNKYFRLYLSDINSNPVIGDNNIFKMMPGGGTPNALSFLVGGATYGQVNTWSSVPIRTGKGNTYGTIGNVLLSQTMTLFFNKSVDPGLGAVELSATMATMDVNCGSDVPIPDTLRTFTISQTIITYLTNNGGATVNNLYLLANRILGGDVIAGIDASSVNSAVDAINNGFDGCRIQVSVPAGLAVPSSDTEAMFSTYPVPFKEYINVRYEFNYQSKARIEVYDAKGLFVMAYNDADAYFNKEVRLDVTFNHGEGQMFFVKVITDKGVSTKKIVSKN